MTQPTRHDPALSKPNRPDLTLAGGLAERILVRLNHILQPRGIKAKVVFREGCLKILLSSARPLDQQTFINFIRRQLHDSEIEMIQSVKVYGQQIGEEMPTWYQEFGPAQLPILIEMPESIAPPKSPFQPKPDYAFLKTLRTFQLTAVFPYPDVLSGALYSSPIVRLLLFFGQIYW